MATNTNASPRTTTALAPVAAAAAASTQIVKWGMDREQLDLIKRTIARGTSDDDFALFMTTANRLGLDPFLRQIYAVMRNDEERGGKSMTIQVGIDGFRLCALRSGDLDGQDGPYWCGEDGVWHDVWLSDGHPKAAKVVVYRKGCGRPFTGIATFTSYVQRKRTGEPNSMWSRGSDFMLAKCAEAVALRKAFPAELAGVVAPEESGTDDAIDAEFTDIKSAPPPGKPAAATAHTSASPPASPPPSAPSAPPQASTSTQASPPKPADAPPAGARSKPPMSTEIALELTGAIQAARDEVELQAVAKRIAGYDAAKTMRDGLLAAHHQQLQLIRDAARADREASQQTGGAS